MNEIRTKTDAKASMTITLASLANLSARQSDMVANTYNRPAAIIYCKIKSGASAPVAAGCYNVYLLRGDDPASSTYRTDGAGATDAAITPVNARLIGTIVTTTNANTTFYGEFDTFFAGVLGPEWGIAILNVSGNALNASGHLIEYVLYTPEVQ